MGRWQRVGLVIFALAAAGPAISPWQPALAASVKDVSALSGDLADMLVILSGTAAVFDSSRIQAALHDPEPLLGPDGQKLDVLKVKLLLKTAGFRTWTERPTLWVVQPDADNKSLTVLSADSRFFSEAKSRGLPLSSVRATDSDASAVIALAGGGEQPALPGLLAGHQADALVVVTPAGGGFRWQFMQPGHQLEGQLSGDVDLPAVLPHVLCEALSGQFQWPEAYGRPVIRVRNVASMGDFAAVEAALQQLKGVHGVSLVRLDGSTAYFAVDPMSSSALAEALNGEARLPADNATAAGIKPLVLQARALGSPVQTRVWAPQTAPAGQPTQLQ